MLGKKKRTDFKCINGPLCEGPNNGLSAHLYPGDLSMHPSFAVTSEELTATFFEVTERRGWGEFSEAQIRIIWKDPLEKATVVCVILLNRCSLWDTMVCMFTRPLFCLFYRPGCTRNKKLYPPETLVNAIPITEKPVVAKPTTRWCYRSYKSRLRPADAISSFTETRYSQQDHFERFDNDDDLQAHWSPEFLKQNW
jgi:hypothetical protein